MPSISLIIICRDFTIVKHQVFINLFRLFILCLTSNFSWFIRAFIHVPNTQSLWHVRIFICMFNIQSSVSIIYDSHAKCSIFYDPFRLLFFFVLSVRSIAIHLAFTSLISSVRLIVTHLVFIYLSCIRLILIYLTSYLTKLTSKSLFILINLIRSRLYQ